MSTHNDLENSIREYLVELSMDNDLTDYCEDNGWMNSFQGNLDDQLSSARSKYKRLIVDCSPQSMSPEECFDLYKEVGRYMLQLASVHEIKHTSIRNFVLHFPTIIHTLLKQEKTFDRKSKKQIKSYCTSYEPEGQMKTFPGMVGYINKRLIGND